MDHSGRVYCNAPAALARGYVQGLCLVSISGSMIAALVFSFPVLAQTINTVAGNGSPIFAGDGELATSASLNQPAGVGVDASGNLYIADTGNHRIRKVDAATGVIATVAGNGTGAFAGDGEAASSASLYYPFAATPDAYGNLYIVDYFNHRIRKVAADTGIITTVAGNGIADFAGDSGLATNASLYYPRGLALDASGNLYIADSGNSRIRKVAATTGIITTVAGKGSFGFSGDGGPATNASFQSVTGVAVDRSGNVFIADENNSRIRKVAAATGIITTVVRNNSSTPGVALDASGNVYFVVQPFGTVGKLQATSGIIAAVAGSDASGQFSGDGGPATSASLNQPFGIALDAKGSVYIADLANNRIRKVLFVARADFDGDGRSDVFWRSQGLNGTGENYIYFLNGTSIIHEGYVRPVTDPDWRIVGVGNFSGEGRADILWRNASTGENYMYAMNGLSIEDEGYLRTVSDHNWQVAGLGDFDGDGRDDIVWRNASTGENYVYLMNGRAIVGEGYLRTVADQQWQVAGIADLDGDGRADIVWRHGSSGQNYLYPMSGISIKPNEGFIRTVADLAWQIAGVGDIDGDGRADILWRNVSTGENYLYPMDGKAIKPSEGYLRTVAQLTWQIVAIGDFDGDGKNDVLWRNSSSGENYLYPMDGAAIKPGEGYLRTVADQLWHVVSAAPRITSPCVDQDGDGYYAQPGCGTPMDCNDQDQRARPGQTTYFLCGSGWNDYNCDGTVTQMMQGMQLLCR